MAHHYTFMEFAVVSILLFVHSPVWPAGHLLGHWTAEEPGTDYFWWMWLSSWRSQTWRKSKRDQCKVVLIRRHESVKIHLACFFNCSLFQMDACCGQWPVGGRPGWLGRTCCRWLFAVLGWGQVLTHSHRPCPSLESRPPGPPTPPAARPELASEEKQRKQFRTGAMPVTHFRCCYILVMKH